MSALQEPVTHEDFLSRRPIFEDMADEIMNYISGLTPQEISTRLGISSQLAVKAHNLAYDFPHKITGYKAIEGFTGEAYKAFDIKSLSSSSIENIDEKLRIISSIYGCLRPSDIIKPYRCEFNKPIDSSNKTPITIFKPKITVEFVKFIKEHKIREVIDLLPADADKCLDWKIIRAFVSVYKINFKTISTAGDLKTPLAKRLKELRGLMCRTIIENGIETFDQLKRVESDNFIYSPLDSKPMLPVFIANA